MLRIENLRAGYGGRVVVDIPELELRSGEHCLILGKSGTGKTTLLYALAGLLSLMSGRICINDTDLTQWDKPALDAFRGRNIGIIYQTLYMANALTVLENLLLAQYAADVPQDPRKAVAVLDSLGLGDFATRKPSTLSQGQQQRVAIARAAMNDPKMILGDEPTSALDDDACDAVMRLLLRTAESTGAILIVATHDARIARHFQRTIRLEGVR